jgi:hypothetical protein
LGHLLPDAASNEHITIVIECADELGNFILIDVVVGNEALVSYLSHMVPLSFEWLNGAAHEPREAEARSADASDGSIRLLAGDGL